MLIVSLLVQFCLESLSADGGGRIGHLQPDVHRAAYLLDAEPIQRRIGRIVVLLTHAGTEQMTQLGHLEVPMHASPAANLVVVQAQLFFPFAKATFDRAATESHSQQPAQRHATARHGVPLAGNPVGQKEFHLAGQHVASRDQAMPPRGQAVFVLAPKHGPFHFPDLGALVGVLDAIALPGLLAKHGRIPQQVANLARRTPASHTRITPRTPAFSRGFRPVTQHRGALHPTVEVAGNLADENLTPRMETIEKPAVSAIQLVERPGRHANAVAQGTIDEVQRDPRLGAKLHLVGDVRFFRRAGSLAQSSGRYTALSSST